MNKGQEEPEGKKLKRENWFKHVFKCLGYHYYIVFGSLMQPSLGVKTLNEIFVFIYLI